MACIDFHHDGSQCMLFLLKVCTEENINIDLHDLSDKELKTLYLQLQTARGHLPYGIRKGEDFETAMKNGTLQIVTFTEFVSGKARTL